MDKLKIMNMEPLGGIEPPTFALPRRRYTSKPQWQHYDEGSNLFNRGGFHREYGNRHCENQWVGARVQPRSHSPVLRGPGKPVGFFPREFKSRPRRQYA